MEAIQDRLRLYSINMYNLSPIQCGIQSSHSNMEYALKNWTDTNFQEWANKHKTVILLNGGASNSGEKSVYDIEPRKGSMEIHLETLLNNNIESVPFYEPDMNNSLTSISLLVENKVYNRKDYPDFEGIVSYNYPNNDKLLSYIEFDELEHLIVDNLITEEFSDWLDEIGGITNLFLRFYLSKLSLSNN